MDDYSLPEISVDDYLADPGRYQLVDVRRAPARAASGIAVEGAVWADPEALTLADPLFDTQRTLAVACVHGHEVSNYITAMALVAGTRAVIIRGGVEALRAAGAAIRPLPRADG